MAVKSVFDRVRKFQPMTPDRLKLLKTELATVALCLPVIFVVFSYRSLHRLLSLAVSQALSLCFSPGVEDSVRAWIASAVVVMRALSQALALPNLHVNREFVGLLFGTIDTVLVSWISLIVIMRFSNGFEHLRLDRTVLAQELVYRLNRRKPPQLCLGMRSVSVANLAIGNVITIVMFALLTFAIASGLLSGLPVLESVEPGFRNWLLASLRDAHIRVTSEGEFNRLRLFMATICACAAFITSPMVFSTVLCLPQKIKLTPTHITFPLELSLALGGRIKRLWVDVENIQILAGSVLEMQFRSGGSAKLVLTSLSEESLQVLLQAVEELCVDCRLDTAVQDLVASCQGEQPGVPSSFTHVWNEGLTTQFKSTIFAPMQTGTTLSDGRLRVVRQLASTPWSATYLARTAEHKVIILKELVLPSADSENSKAKELFDRECQVLLSLRHPGIAKVQDHFRENGRDYLIIDYTPGRDLQQVVLTRGPMTQREVCAVAIQVCEVLQYLHSLDVPVIHRDVSPDNLLLDNDERIHLIDFGAAKHLVQNATGTLIGKQSYIAPEQLRGKSSAKSDLYSLGATMHALMTGKAPVALRSCSPIQCGAKDITTELDSLVTQLTALDEDERPASADEVRLRLLLLREQRPERSFRIKLDTLEHQKA